MATLGQLHELHQVQIGASVIDVIVPLLLCLSFTVIDANVSLEYLLQGQSKICCYACQNLFLF